MESKIINNSNNADSTTIKRMNWVDYSRGFGIILVVFGHASDSAVRENLIYAGTDFLQLVVTTSNKIVYMIHLPIFFFMAGMFAVKSLDRSLKVVIKNKITVILYPYVIWGLILGISKILFQGDVYYKNEWLDLLLIFYKPIGITWFLYVLFWSFILYLCLSKVINVFFLLLLSLIMYYFYPDFDLKVLNKLFRFFIFFVIGASLYKYMLIGNIEKYFNIWFSVFSFLILGVLFKVFHFMELEYYWMRLIIGILGVYFIISLSIILASYNKLKIIEYFGLISIMMYLSHIIPLTITRIILLKHLSVYNAFLHIAIQMASSIFLSLMFIKLVDKLKMRTLLFGR